MKTIKQIEKKIREICTYHADEGTSGYLLSEEQFDQINQAITELLEGLRVEERTKFREVYGPSYDADVQEERGYNEAIKEINAKIDQAKGGER